MIFDNDTCDSPFLFLIEEGNSDGTDLSGCKIAMSSIFPGPTLFDGNGTSRVYIDENTTADQQRELEEIFKGKKGGPMEIIGGLISEWLPTKITAIEVQENGDTLTATIGDFGTIKSQLLKNEEGQQMTMKDVGFTVALQFEDHIGQLAPSGSKWTDPDLPHQFETQSGVQGFAQWNGG
ncbi:DUF1326 domain-containing protein [Aliifodinibius sp. S!AR15-10]|nr:DUF1326 domain-containing protein [Aliifodinibius sp. S!AR15-10]